MEKDSRYIKQYQKYLKEKGYYKGEVNGILSDELKKAIKKCVYSGHYVGEE